MRRFGFVGAFALLAACSDESPATGNQEPAKIENPQPASPAGPAPTTDVPSGPVPQSGELVYCAENTVTILNPALNNTVTNLKVVHQNVFDQLVEFDQDLKLVPGLAESWTVDEGGLAYTFKLRKNVAFHKTTNGFEPKRTFNADDVVYTFKRYADATHPLYATPSSNGSNFTYWKFKKMDALVAGIDKVDDYTVKFRLKYPEAELLDILATAAFSIFSAEHGAYVIKKNADFLATQAGTPDPKTLPINEFDTSPVGTGPFRIVSLADGALQLESQAEHFRGAPKVKSVKIMPVVDGKARAEKAASGECHISSDPLVADYEALQTTNSATLSFQTMASKNINFITMSQTNVADARLRRAISMAFDRAKYVAETFGGKARPVASLADESLLGTFTAPAAYKLDRNAAKALVAEAGATGRTMTLLYMPVSRPYNLDGKKLAQLMKADLEQVNLVIRTATIGVDKTVAAASQVPVVMYDDTPNANYVTDYTKYTRYVTDGKHELAQLGDNPLMPSAKDRYLNAVKAGIAAPGKTGTNYSHWWSQPFEDLSATISQTTDPTAIKTLFGQAEAILATEVPYAPILAGNIFRIVSKNVSGYQLHPLHIERFNVVSLSSAK